MPAVSLCMIVRDEEDKIGACLESARPYVQEMIVVDTGSQDRTVEIAREQGASVFFLQWTEHFAEARNFALKQASGQWILVLDADEVLTAVDSSRFTELLSDETAAGYYLTIRHLRSSRPADYETDTVCRLFRNLPGIAYRGRIHEDISSSLARRYPLLHLKNSGLVLTHHGYLQETVHHKDKAARNLRLLALAIEEERDKLYYRYALGAEYFLQERLQEAADTLAPLLTLVPPAAGYAADLAYKLAYARYRSGSLIPAIHAAETGLVREPSNRELQELRAMLLLEADRPEEALFALQRLQPDRGDTEAAARRQMALGAANKQLGNWLEALQCFEQAAGGETTRSQALAQWLDLATLLHPAAWVCERLSQPPFSLAGTESLLAICPYVMKGAAASPPETLQLLEAHNPGSDVDASAPETAAGAPDNRLLFYKAVLLAQTGQQEAAALLLEQLMAINPQQHLLLYLWALDNRDGAAPVSVNRLYEYSSLFPDLGGIANQLLGHPSAEPAASVPWTQAAYAMLMTGAWSGFLLTWTHYLRSADTNASAARKLPRQWRLAILRSPEGVRQAVYDRLRTVDGGSLGDRLFAAELAHSLDHKQEAQQIRQSLLAQYPQRMEPWMGLYRSLQPLSGPDPFLLLTE